MQVFCVLAVIVSLGVFSAKMNVHIVAVCLIGFIGKGSVKTSGRINRISNRKLFESESVT